MSVFCAEFIPFCICNFHLACFRILVEWLDMTSHINLVELRVTVPRISDFNWYSFITKESIAVISFITKESIAVVSFF